MAIYFIGGPPKCGKTTIAKRLSKQSNISWISADTLQNIVWAYTPQLEHAARFPHTYMAGDNPDETYAEHSIQESVEQYIAQGKTTYDAIHMMAETYFNDEEDFIVEGYQVTPEIVARIQKDFGNDHVRAAFVGKFDAAQLVNDFHKTTLANDWIIEGTQNPETHRKIADMVAEYSQYFRAETEKYQLPFFELDKDFAGATAQVIKSLITR